MKYSRIFYLWSVPFNKCANESSLFIRDHHASPFVRFDPEGLQSEILYKVQPLIWGHRNFTVSHVNHFSVTFSVSLSSLAFHVQLKSRICLWLDSGFLQDFLRNFMHASTLLSMFSQLLKIIKKVSFFNFHYQTRLKRLFKCITVSLDVFGDFTIIFDTFQNFLRFSRL